MATIEIVFLLISTLGVFTGFFAIYGVVMRASWMEALLRKSPIHPRIKSMTGNRLYAVLIGLFSIVFFGGMFFAVLTEFFL